MVRFDPERPSQWPYEQAVCTGRRRNATVAPIRTVVTYVTAGSIAPMPVIRSWLSDESIPASRINRKARHCGRTARIQPVQRVERRALGGMPEGFVVCGGDKGLGKKKAHRI